MNWAIVIWCQWLSTFSVPQSRWPRPLPTNGKNASAQAVAPLRRVRRGGRWRVVDREDREVVVGGEVG